MYRNLIKVALFKYVVIFSKCPRPTIQFIQNGEFGVPLCSIALKSFNETVFFFRRENQFYVKVSMSRGSSIHDKQSSKSSSFIIKIKGYFKTAKLPKTCYELLLNRRYALFTWGN